MTVWELLAWTGNGCYFTRFLWQWLASERAGHSVTPRSFWALSLAGAALCGSYALRLGELVLFAGYVVNGLIYARSALLARGRPDTSRLGPLPAAVLGATAAGILMAVGTLPARAAGDLAPGWLACALVGQVAWSSRFVVQWWYAERRGRTDFPPAFWWLSLVGNALLFAYTLHLGEGVFIAQFVLGPIVHVRNLVLGTKRAALARHDARE